MVEPDSGQHFATRSRVEKKSLTFFREAGRGKALVHINNLVKFNPGLVLLMGEEGSGRSRVLKQFADSLKDKSGKVCILDRAIKNDHQLYNAITDGFGIDHIPGDDVKSIQKGVYAFLEANVTTNKPIIIALDDIQRCSLAMLEALIELQKKFRPMSLILVGDNSLQKMLQRLQGGKITANPVLLSALDAREVRQYMNWRLPFQITDIELNNIINLSRGNLGLLEQQALKKEANHEQKNSQKSDGGVRLSRQSLLRLLLITALLCITGVGYFLFPEQFSQERFSKIFDKTVLPETAPLPLPPVRSNEEWVERQINLLSEVGQISGQP